ncbi:MAG: glycosyltransferase family 2 protein [Chloroflexi bacterium]|nr:glycosyltransferase family 2 protein [Chloroflexota bacterium]
MSVIIPVHNGEQTLEECLRAVFQSDYPRFEVIVVDDRSTDRSTAIAGEFPCHLVRSERRGGAAEARNVGARKSQGEVLFFTDCDVFVQHDTIGKLITQLREQPASSAVFGSYTAETRSSNFFSRYKNLVHHFTHQTACEDATTFWAGCGAIEDGAFFGVGGFDPADTDGADVEDIALGYRLVRAGHKIRVARDAQVIHAKHYTFVGLLRSDVMHRAVPWTKLMIQQRIWRNDLNTRWENLLSTGTAFGLLMFLILSVASPPYLAALPLLLALFAYLNRQLFGLFRKRNGSIFLLEGMAMTLLYYVYCVIGMVLGVLFMLIERRPGVRGLPSLQRESLGVGREAGAVASSQGEK